MSGGNPKYPSGATIIKGHVKVDPANCLLITFEINNASAGGTLTGNATGFENGKPLKTDFEAQLILINGTSFEGLTKAKGMEIQSAEVVIKGGPTNITTITMFEEGGFNEKLAVAVFDDGLGFNTIKAAQLHWYWKEGA
jgi:hypothetical protein